MVKEKYITYRIKRELLNKIDNFIKNNENYRSKAHFIELAVKEKLEKESKDPILKRKYKGSVGGSPILADLIKRIEKLEKKKKDED